MNKLKNKIMYYELRKNNQVIKTYKHRGHAERGLNALYNNGKVLPSDKVYINFVLDLF